MINVTVTRSGVDWSNAVPIGTDVTAAQYAALPSRTMFIGDGFTLDLSEETDTGFSYDEIVGRTISEIRDLFPAESDNDFKQVTVRASGPGDFYIPGSSDPETIIGGTGDDILDDGNLAGFSIGYTDNLFGGAGDDTFFVHTYDSFVHENAGEGDDTVITDAPFQLQNGESIETLVLLAGAQYGGGNDLANTIVGSAEADLLFGYAGADLLTANGGDDILQGGQGNDRMTGGGGSDLFLFKGEAGRDFIFGFGAEDVLVSTTRLRDGNGDGIIDFGGDRELDINKGASVAIADSSGRVLRALEYDGTIQDSGVIYYVYSLVGSVAGVAAAAAHDLSLANAYDPAI